MQNRVGKKSKAHHIIGQKIRSRKNNSTAYLVLQKLCLLSYLFIGIVTKNFPETMLITSFQTTAFTFTCTNSIINQQTNKITSNDYSKQQTMYSSTLIHAIKTETHIIEIQKQKSKQTSYYRGWKIIYFVVQAKGNIIKKKDQDLKIIFLDIRPYALKASQLRTLRLAQEIPKHSGHTYNVDQICNFLRVICNHIFHPLQNHFPQFSSKNLRICPLIQQN